MDEVFDQLEEAETAHMMQLWEREQERDSSPAPAERPVASATRRPHTRVTR